LIPEGGEGYVTDAPVVEKTRDEKKEVNGEDMLVIPRITMHMEIYYNIEGCI